MLERKKKEKNGDKKYSELIAKLVEACPNYRVDMYQKKKNEPSYFSKFFSFFVGRATPT